MFALIAPVDVPILVNEFGELKLIGNFSIRFWKQYMSLFALVAIIVVPVVDFR